MNCVKAVTRSLGGSVNNIKVAWQFAIHYVSFVEEVIYGCYLIMLILVQTLLRIFLFKAVLLEHFHNLIF